ncbi:hypothetical protein CKA27_12515 [Vibrio coralliilyticus]|nr:hypothetical protein [Vibrio coralliilyticus]PAT67576.1 hypothetical protein CKA27_12515 [Vibrio coralliilyticus]
MALPSHSLRKTSTPYFGRNCTPQVNLVNNKVYLDKLLSGLLFKNAIRVALRRDKSCEKKQFVAARPRKGRIR